MSTVQPRFGPWDYAVLALVLVISSAIGVYYRFTGGKQKTVKEYLLADKNMSVAPVAFSLMASFMSAITLLGVSSENYTYGAQFIVINVAYALATPVAAHLYLPVFFRLQATSAYEYLEKRFGSAARLAASVAYSLQMILYMGVVLYAPSLALEALTGISRTAAILTVGVVCTFYSTIGGMKAVLMTDVFQSLLMFAAIFCVIIYETADKGGVSEIIRIANEGGRTELLNFDPDPLVRHSWFTLVIGGFVTFLTVYASNQTQIQRYLTVRDLRTAQKTVWVSWPITSFMSLATSFAGLCIYSRYHGCDPVESGAITSMDQLMPYYVVDTMGNTPGLSGLFVAGIFSASLSTISAAMNSLAAVTLEDYFKPVYRRLKGRELQESKMALRTKTVAFLYGFVFMGLAFLAQFLGGVFQAAYTIFGVVGGPLLGFFTLGMFTVTANEKGALTGLLSGLCIALWMGFGQPRPSPTKLPVNLDGCNATEELFARDSSTSEETEYFWLYKVSYLYNGLVGLIITFVVGYIISYVTRKVTGEVIGPMDPNLFVPPLARRLEKRWDKPLNLNTLCESEEDVRKAREGKRGD